jgi:hypothetical protein
VRAVCPGDQSDFFVRLTGVWIAAAYGHRAPAAARVDELCGEWERLFAEGAVDAP